jgi:hypothetical protein
MVNDLALADKHDWAVSHCGVPIWLLNTGKNPRRPHRQLKFTLAEKGTGFILWQDRIDYRSEFRVFQKKSTDSYSVYDPSQVFSAANSLRNFLVTFKASDRKTLVFIKFDFSADVVKFYEYYMQAHLKRAEENRQRARSLPVGVGNQISINRNTLQKIDNSKLESETSCKRHSKCSNSLINEYKYRRLSKCEISNPCSPRHIINVKISEKDSFYTLSKLLPRKVDTPLVISEKRLSNLMCPSFSPSSSSSSSSCSSTCSSSASPKLQVF